MRHLDEIHLFALIGFFIFVLLMGMLITSHIETTACLENGGTKDRGTCRFTGS